MEHLLFKDESYNIIKCCFEVYNVLGRGFLEIVYKDALEYEFGIKNVPYEREKIFNIEYKDIILPHYYASDFLVYDEIILEVKCMNAIVDEHIKQTLNYLAVSKKKLGIIVNFGEGSLKYKRVIL
jgi:GxxExxY protein